MTLEKLLKNIICYALPIWLVLFTFAFWAFDGTGEILKEFFVNWRGGYLAIVFLWLMWSINDLLNDFLEDEF